MTTTEIYQKIRIIEDYRAGLKGRARTRMINQIRTDALESKIAHLESIGNHDGAAAVRWVARDIGAPIDESLIDLQVKVRKSFLQ